MDTRQVSSPYLSFQTESFMRAIGLKSSNMSLSEAINFIKETHEDLKNKVVEEKPLDEIFQIENLQELKQNLEIAKDIIVNMPSDPDDLQMKVNLAITHVRKKLTDLGILDDLKPMPFMSTPTICTNSSSALFQTFHPLGGSSDNLKVSSEISETQEVEFLNCPERIQKLLLKDGKVWIHGPQGSSKYAIVQTYLSTYADPNIKCFEITAGDHVADLSINLIQAMKKIRKEWNTHLPPNYLETIAKEEKCLFIVQGVKMNHLYSLKGQMKEMPNQQWIILSTTQIHTKSLHILFDRNAAEQWIEKAGIDLEGKFALLEGFSEEHSFSQDPLFLPIAIEAYKNYKGEFLAAWSNARKKNNSCLFLPFLIKFIQGNGENLSVEELLVLKNHKIKKDFFQNSRSIDNLVKYKLVHIVDQDYFVLPEKIRGEMQKIAGQEDANDLDFVLHLIQQFREYIGSGFNEANKWTIPHIRFLFQRHEKGCPEPMLFPLASLMWNIGYFYTQVDTGEGKTGPQEAKKISMHARNVIEDFINRKYRLAEETTSLFLTKSPEELVQLMNDTHPLLAHLYVNLQYQIGRCYFYLKDPGETMGSKTVLNFAKRLAEHIDKGETLLFKLIDRNGLLFHLNEEKKYQEAICGYKALLEGKMLIDVAYHNESKKAFELQEDTQFQIACTEFILHNMMEEKSMDEEQISGSILQLEELCQKTAMKHPRSALILIRGYLKIRRNKEASVLINELKCQNLTTLNQLQVIENEIFSALLNSSPEETSNKAKEYRRLAEAYYKKGFYASYNYLQYEEPAFCQKEIETKHFDFRPLSFYCSSIQGKWLYDEISTLTIEVYKKRTNPTLPFHFQVKYEVKSQQSNSKGTISSRSNLPSQLQPIQEDKQYPIEGRILHTLSNGPNQLILGDGMYRLISQRGEMGQLMRTLKNEKDFMTSKFGQSHGYRLILQNLTSMHGKKLLPSQRNDLDCFIDAMENNKEDWTEFAECYISRKNKYIYSLNKQTECLITTKELYTTAQKIQELPLFQEAREFVVTTSELENVKEGQIERFLLKHVNQFHFPALSTFAYHALKHLEEGAESLLFGKGPDYLFNVDQFQEIAKIYLNSARTLVKQANWRSVLPDQTKDETVDYAYYGWTDKPEDFKNIYHLQEEVRSLKKRVKSLKAEKQNSEYPIDNNSKIISSKKSSNMPSKAIAANTLSAIEKSLDKAQEELNLKRRNTVSKVATYMTTLRVAREENNIKIFFKTYFLDKDKFDLNRAREGQLK